MPAGRLVIYPYSIASKSAKDLAAALETRRLRKDGTYTYKIEGAGLDYQPTTSERMV
jgi:energy-coupling factor transporter transmembrane protein EcfT